MKRQQNHIDKEEGSRWRGQNKLKINASLTIIVAAALLLEVTVAVMYYSAQHIIQRTNEQLVMQEMKGIAMDIRKQLAKAEVVINNYAWVVGGDVENPVWMFETSHSLVEHNAFLYGCGVAFVPNYYPKEGYWFQPYAARRQDGTVESLQLGSESHDYTKTEPYIFVIEHDSDHWSEPYYDVEGAQSMVTTYSSPAHDNNDNLVAVVGADISLTWLKDVVEKPNGYHSVRRFLVSRENNLICGEDCYVYRQALDLVMNDDDDMGYVTMKDEGGEKQHVFYYPVGGITGWKLICICSDREIFASLRKTRLVLLLLQLSGMFLIGFIVWRTTRNLGRLRKVNAEKDRISGELKVASDIQQSMLPRREWKEECGEWRVEIVGSLVPAREVGGDLFDYYIRDEKLFFCIGDVSGKGAASAMVMGVAHALFRSASAHENNPARIMHTINETGCNGNDSNMFVTMFIGVLDLPTGFLRYCNAGHDCPFVVGSAEKGVECLECAAHLPLGVFEDMRYNMQERRLDGDCTIFLYTDGVTEAKNNERDQFGLERVKDTLSACNDRQPREMLEAVTQRVSEFVGDAEQSDDLTLMAIRYTPRRFESIFEETITLMNDIDEVPRLGNFMKEAAERLDIEQAVARKLRLAVEEAVVNVMEYAYPAGKEGDVEVDVMSDGKVIKITITDEGVPFDPTATKKADTTLAAEDRQIGGLGILLVRELMDIINYERSGNKNILTLTKKIKK